MKRHENALRIGTFWHQLAVDNITIFGWLICHFDQKRENCPVLRTPPQTEPRDTEALISDSALADPPQ